MNYKAIPKFEKKSLLLYIDIVVNSVNLQSRDVLGSSN